MGESAAVRYYRKRARDPEFLRRRAERQAKRRAAETPEQRDHRCVLIAMAKAARSPEQRARDTEAMKQASERRRALIAEQKNAPCADCLVRYPPHVMQFDHRPGEEKLCEVSQMVSRRWSLVLAEIAKCDVVCANCHAERTHRRRRT